MSDIDPSLLDATKLFDYSGTRNRSIAIYCWSRTERGTALWNEAETLGRLAAANGFSVITGGYCGSMEAVSQGAREVVDTLPSDQRNPEVVGILVNGQFPDRVLTGNKYLTSSIDAPNFPRRVELLVSQSRYFVILPGTLGTLQELATVWTMSYVHPAGLPRPVILAYRDPWERVITFLADALKIPSDIAALVQFVDNAEDALRLINADAAQQTS